MMTMKYNGSLLDRHDLLVVHKKCLVVIGPPLINGYRPSALKVDQTPRNQAELVHQVLGGVAQRQLTERLRCMCKFFSRVTGLSLDTSSKPAKL